VQENAVAPVEDLTLSFEEFESLCASGQLKPQAHNLAVKPRIRVWKARFTGHAEIEGFLPNSVLRLAGCKAGIEGSQEKVQEYLEKTWVAFLRKTFPGCEITVSPLTTLNHG